MLRFCLVTPSSSDSKIGLFVFNQADEYHRRLAAEAQEAARHHGVAVQVYDAGDTAADATSITVQRCTGTTCTAFADVARLAATATSWADLGVKSRTTYRYRLFASGDAGTSPYSNIASATAR